MAYAWGCATQMIKITTGCSTEADINFWSITRAISGYKRSLILIHFVYWMATINTDDVHNDFFILLQFCKKTII